MILEKFIKTHKALFETRLLRPFLAKPYGLELALILLEFHKKNQETSVDETYRLITSPLPRREAFGMFLQHLQESKCISKGEHSKKKSKKNIALNDAIVIKITNVLSEH